MEISKTDYQFLIDGFGEERIIDRYSWLYSMIDDYIKQNNLTECVAVSEDVLNSVFC